MNVDAVKRVLEECGWKFEGIVFFTRKVRIYASKKGVRMGVTFKVPLEKLKPDDLKQAFGCRRPKN